jgi:ACS family 4-hydroxyphenylacetate permease-like MFS transporter
LVSSAGILASAISPAVIGALRDLTGSFVSELWYATLLLGISTIAMLAVRSRPRAEIVHPVESTV